MHPWDLGIVDPFGNQIGNPRSPKQGAEPKDMLRRPKPPVMISSRIMRVLKQQLLQINPGTVVSLATRSPPFGRLPNVMVIREGLLTIAWVKFHRHHGFHLV